MKIWISKNSEVPVREQIIAQVTLGIASGDLAIGEKLASTSEIARRFRIHSNTVSNAYQILAEQGWLEFRKGSGFYVREIVGETAENSLDRLIKIFFRQAQERGFTLSEIKTRLAHLFDIQPPDHFLVVEDDAGFREILVEEIRSAVGFKVFGISYTEFIRNPQRTGALLTAMFDEKAKINAHLKPPATCIFLNARSVAETMKDQKRPTSDDLIAIVSGWEKFLLLAKTMLIAARIDSESLIVRSTHEINWQKGLDSASLIICDALTAKSFAQDARLRPFPLISDESLQELIKSK